MPGQYVNQTFVRLASLVFALVGAVLVLTSCSRATVSPVQSAIPSATASVSTPSQNGSLTCTLSKGIAGIDVISARLSCTVSGAAADETSFTLTYTATGPNGQGRPMGPLCTGSLQQGAGTCSQSYSIVAPYGGEAGSVAGEAMPDHRPLGPVTPTLTTQG